MGDAGYAQSFFKVIGQFIKIATVRFGRISDLMPIRLAATTFSRIPPTANTWPEGELTGHGAAFGFLLVARGNALAMVMPALGPSLGVAPSGTWR